MGRNQYWAGRVYDLCVYYMTGTPEGSTESGFMEKPGIEPATPGLQGIALIHYTTGASSLGIIKIQLESNSLVLLKKCEWILRYIMQQKVILKCDLFHFTLKLVVFLQLS